MAQKSLFRYFIRSQVWLAKKFDRLLPHKFSTPGYKDSKIHMIREHLIPGITIYDFGSGSRPFLNAKRKEQLHARVVGIDVDPTELKAAPTGLYDQTVCTDIMYYSGENNADIVVCMAVLEHIRDNNKAMGAIASTLKPGGKALLYMPCRNAPFARLNRILPENLKRRILHWIFPSQHTGFRVFYDRCTPWELEALANQYDLKVIDKKLYFTQHYFAFFFPLHLVWRLWSLLSYSVLRDKAIESFALILEKPPAKTVSQ